MALWYAWHPVNTETFMALILVVVVNANDKDYFACNYTLWKMSKLFKSASNRVDALLHIFIFSYRHWPELTEVSSFRYIKYNTMYIVAYIM